MNTGTTFGYTVWKLYENVTGYDANLNAQEIQA